MFWGIIAIGLGVYEAQAFVFRKLPTISAATWQANERFGWKSRGPLIISLLALGRHLWGPPK